MDYDENSLNSMPTVADGTRRPAEPYDEPSLGSAPTMVGHGVPGAALGQIDQYQLVRKLGGGGFGVVYLARDTVSGVDVALKTLHPLLKSNPEEMEALRAKFALVSRLSHPNIASPLVLHPCRDIAITDDGVRNEMRLSPRDFIMVMRYAPGVTLSKWRKQFPDGVVPLDQALEVVRQVASALDYAHGEKIVHRDIKPANIMVETVGISTTEKTENTEAGGTGSVHSVPSVVPKIRVRILDFGLAAEIRSSMSRISTETGDTSGTRPYMAPEQWLGRKQDGRTDQYALACVAYELLSGAPPFAGAFETGDPVIMMATVKGETPEEIEDVPAHVNAALQKALAKNPKERFGSCAEFVGAISNAEAQSAHRGSHTEAQRQGERLFEAFNPEFRNPNPASTSAISEAEVLRRKVALERTVKAIPAEDRADKELKVFVEELETELVVLDQACRYSRFAAAAESLGLADVALVNFREAKDVRAARGKICTILLRRQEALALAERKAREEAERKAREEAERKAREEAERRAREEAARKVLEKAERDRRKYLEAEEAKRKAREEAERKAREEQERREAAGPKPGELKAVSIAPGVSMNLRWCPATTSIAWKKISGGHDFFSMGSPDGEEGRGLDERLHEVILTNGFWLGETPVTQGVWEEVMGNNPSSFLDRVFLGFGGKTSAQRPVENVSWDDCQEFLKKINAHSFQSGLCWALPTEAQWEYACRAGTTGAYGGIGKLYDMGWYGLDSGGKTHPVKQKQPNAWGLYDMHGNVWEWCADRYGTYPSGSVTDPAGPASGSIRVRRGGSWYFNARSCRSAARGGHAPGFRGSGLGFRVALVPV